MGASTSHCLTGEDIQELRSPEISQFTGSQITLLYQRFQELDKQQRALLSSKDLLAVPELAMNPLKNRLVALFDHDRKDQINFKDFVRALWIFSDRCSWEEKLAAAFQVYDVDEDGQLSEMDLLHILKLNVGDNMSEEELARICTKTIDEADPDGKGWLSISDLSHALGKEKIHSMMTIDFEKQLTGNL